MKLNDKHIEQVLEHLAASTRSPRGAYSAMSSRPLLEKRIAVRRQRRFLRIVSSVAAVAILCILSWSGYLYLAPAEMLTLSTLAETKQIQLPDGSEVVLNRYSSLTYPDKFKRKNREVALLGEAYFAVSKDRKHPFIVQAGEVSVRVLGTEFNVEAYSRDELVKTTLYEGSVAMDTEDNNSLVLAPGESAIYNKVAKSLSKEKTVQLEDEIAWQKGALVFTNVTLREIARQLSNAFNVDIHIADQQTAELKVTGRFVRGETLDDILRLLQEVGRFTVNREHPTQYILCNP